MIKFEKVIDSNGINTVAELAHEIWNQHYISIIGKAQVDYMLEKFQSAGAIAKQIKDGHEYYIILKDQEKAGYLGLFPEVSLNRMMLSKIYVRSVFRKSGIGSSVMEFTKNLSKQRNINTIWLTVNRFNENSINWYMKKGFVVAEEAVKDIGNGFVMDDFIMEMKI